METTESEFGTGKDWYSTDATSSDASERTYLDITAIVAAQFGGSVEAAWAAMATFANSLHLQYDYEVPSWTGTHAVDCNAATLSVLNAIGVDARPLGYQAVNYMGWFGSFPGW